MVLSRFRKLVGTETMRDRLKPYLQKLEYRYSANEGTAGKLLSDDWKQNRHNIVVHHFNGDKERMRNPTDEDFKKIAELMFDEWYSSGKSTMEDSENEWGYGPSGDRNLNDENQADYYGALKKRKKKTKRKRDKSKSKSKSNSAPKSASKKKPKKKKPKKNKSKKKRTKRMRR